MLMTERDQTQTDVLHKQYKNRKVVGSRQGAIGYMTVHD